MGQTLASVRLEDICIILGFQNEETRKNLKESMDEAFEIFRDYRPDIEVCHSSKSIVDRVYECPDRKWGIVTDMRFYRALEVMEKLPKSNLKIPLIAYGHYSLNKEERGIFYKNGGTGFIRNPITEVSTQSAIEILIQIQSNYTKERMFAEMARRAEKKELAAA